MSVKYFIILFLSFLITVHANSDKTWIRVNQIGYKENGTKIAVILSKTDLELEKIEIYNAVTDELVFTSDKIESFDNYLNFPKSFRADFTELKTSGAYYVKANTVISPIFRIGNDVYNGTADFLLNYMRQQRCGFNPFLNDSCHVNDGFRIYHPADDSLHIDVTGGWHDASDYLQYVTTSANALFQMMFAFQNNPKAFKDNYNAKGLKGPNGIPDIVDEIKWGIDWLLKMNPNDIEFYNQIADDRDHMGFRLPTLDSISYGKNLERPVYLATGTPQGVFKHKNRSEGLASAVGKFASAFALASQILKPYYPELTETLKEKSLNAYKVGKENPGVCQTAPCRAPYFYEEDNYVDDMQLAAIQLYNLTNDKNYLDESAEFGRKEIVTPWIGADTAKHYQWYPFVNLGHSYIANTNSNYSDEFVNYIKIGLEKIYERANDNAFLNGIPFIWCSNNLIAAALTQCRIYSNITGDDKFKEMENSLLDWLFGVNPWGTTMIVGLPAWGDYPSDPHSAFWHNHQYQTLGGLVDGPVYASIFNKLIGIKIYNGDEYSEFQNDYVVYHDDYGDYSTNEPTMDGTASLSYYLSSLESIGNSTQNSLELDQGAIVRGDTSKKEIALVFTGHEYAEGGEIINEVLNKHNIKAAFFLTGDFYRNPNHKNLIDELVINNHYLGAHSDKHLLYADWSKRDSTLISKTEFQSDLKQNYQEMIHHNIDSKNVKLFLPPFEWYNEEISSWTNELGIQLVNYSKGTLSTADYTTPTMKNYRSSSEIFESILSYERSNSLNGFILLSHIGTAPERTDKFYNQLDKLITYLIEKGYSFKRIDLLLNE